MPPDLTAFAKQFDIQLLTHNDPKGRAYTLDGPQAFDFSCFFSEWLTQLNKF
jgi:hypothetical protein